MMCNMAFYLFIYSATYICIKSLNYTKSLFIYYIKYLNIFSENIYFIKLIILYVTIIKKKNNEYRISEYYEMNIKTLMTNIIL